MRTMKQKQNEAMSVFGLHKILQNDCMQDDCMQELATSIDGRVDYYEDYLDNEGCDNSEECAYRVMGAMMACLNDTQPDQCVTDTIGDDCAACVPPSEKKLPEFTSDCADCRNQLYQTVDTWSDMAESEEDGCDENNCAKRAIGLLFVCMFESYPDMDGVMQCVVDNAGDDCHTCACNVWSYKPDGDHTHPDSCDSLHRRNKKTSRKNKN